MAEPTLEKQIETISPSRKRLAVEIPTAEVDKEFESVLREYVNRAKMPGFRKGHAPKEMVSKAFGDDIRGDVYENIIPRVLSARLDVLGVKPVNAPKISGLKHEDGQSLSFTAEFDVIPAFELPPLDEVRIKKQAAEVSGEEIDKAVEEIRARAAEYMPVSARGVGDGDYVVVDLQGRDLASGHLLPADKAVVLAGHKDNEQGLNETLAGMTTGETRTFRTSYDKENPNKRLAGKEIEYRLKVMEIKEKKLPALDDEFAKSLGQYAGLEEFKDKLKNELMESRQRELRNKMTREILDQLAAKIKLEAPRSLVEAETMAIMERALQSIRGASVPRENLDRLKVEAEKQAVEHVNHHLILDKLAEKEGLAATEEEIKTEVDRLAKENNVTAAAIEDYLKKEGRREELVEGIVFRKSVDILTKKAIMD